MAEPVSGADLDAAQRFGFGRLFWLTHEAVVGADLRSQRIVLWNPSAERIFGYPHDEAVGMPLDRLVPGDLVDAHHAGIDRFRSGGPAHLVGGPPVEVRAVRNDGAELTVSLTLTAVADDRRHVAAVIRDVTEERAAERDRQRAFEAMRVFLAAASHDLRSPLMTTAGFAQLLLDPQEDISADERADMAGRILRASEHAVRLVDDLLTVSEIEARAVEVRAHAVTIDTAVREAIAETGASVDVGDTSNLEVRVDRHHLHRILVNLLINAAKYGRPPVTVAAESAGDAIAIRVCDAGDGVPDDVVDSLFDPFTRSREARGRGSGLGLSIVKGLAEANGGRVRYDRSEGTSCFVVTLPAAR
jgi:PAS domain S-box-containing protein